MTAVGFELEAVTHLIRPWGEPAGDLERLRQGIAEAPDEVLFHHAVQYQLRHQGAEELPPDDWSAWIGGVVQDAETAERLSFAVQNRNTSASAVRAALLGVLDALPAKRRLGRSAPEGSEFPFLFATPVSFPTGTVVNDASELMEALFESDASVWFHHLIEEPWFGEGRAPLLEWLDARSDPRSARWIEEAGANGLPIGKARTQVASRWRRSRIAHRVTEAAASPPEVRREAGRQAIANLMRRATTKPDDRS